MKSFKVALIVVSMLVSGVSFATNITPTPSLDINKDLKNLGPAAQGVKVVLAGVVTVNAHYPSSGPVTFASSVQGGNTVLAWGNANIPNNNAVPFHVGWGTSQATVQVIDMYWTDAAGNRLAGSVICNVPPSGNTIGNGAAFVSIRNDFNSAVGGTRPITISNLRFVAPGKQIPLDSLNASSVFLNARWQPVPGGTSVVINPNTALTLQIPGTYSKLSPIVVSYGVDCASGASATTDYCQFLIHVRGGAVPGVSPLGGLLLAILLATSALWAFKRRTRSA